MIDGEGEAGLVQQTGYPSRLPIKVCVSSAHTRVGRSAVGVVVVVIIFANVSSPL